jgi:hypothetical protein
MFFGIAALLPLMLFSFQVIMNGVLAVLENGTQEHGQVLALITPILLMIAPLIAIYITTLRFIRVSSARHALIIHTCGVSYCSLFLGHKIFGYAPSLFLASFIPYFYVRWIGRGMLNYEKQLTQCQIEKFNSVE